MEMKVKSSLIRKYRTERLWSQEQLAQVCGLGLRTIQRIESRGSASIETIKALASVFEVDSATLCWRDGGYQVYKHKQWGIAVFLTMPILVAGALLLDHHIPSFPTIALGILFGIFTIVTFMFSSMTVEVNESEVSWFFGPGVFKNSMMLEEIGECSKVRNSFWLGFGIHSFGTGWIYNVSGLLAVEIELKSGSMIRLGSDQPKYLMQAIIDAKDNSAE